jgi:hypothetical protein
VTDLETLANLAEVLGTLTIVGGLLFAVIQIRQYRVPSGLYIGTFGI